jgi:hypothetical protein
MNELDDVLGDHLALLRSKKLDKSLSTFQAKAWRQQLEKAGFSIVRTDETFEAGLRRAAKIAEKFSEDFEYEVIIPGYDDIQSGGGSASCWEPERKEKRHRKLTGKDVANAIIAKIKKKDV